MPLNATSLDVSTVLIMARVYKPSVLDTLKQVVETVCNLGLTPVLDADTAAKFKLDAAHCVVTETEFGANADVAIVIGGDGSILHAGRALASENVPVIGVNRGRLGFLADVSPTEVLSKLTLVLKGDYQIDTRSLLHMQVFNDQGEITCEDIALNDVVLHAGKSVHMVDFELSIDDAHVYRQHSDGLIIATPTGSTAYALSGGGPIIHPGLDAMVAVPMHPHTLTSRPIVIHGSSSLKVAPHADNRVQPMISADGQSSVAVPAGGYVLIQKHPDQLKLLHPPGYDFYAACRTKLGWNLQHDFDGDAS